LPVVAWKISETPTGNMKIGKPFILSISVESACSDKEVVVHLLLFFCLNIYSYYLIWPFLKKARISELTVQL